MKQIKWLSIVFLLATSFQLVAYEQSLVRQGLPRLLIKMPTRSRPKKFFKVLDRYYRFLSGKVPYHFVVSCDIDDTSMNTPSVRNKFKTYSHLTVHYSESKGKVEAVNRDVDKHLDFDVLLVASDDMIPQIKGFDRIIMRDMLKNYPDLDGTLNYHDGFVGDELNTIPLMGRKYYERFGYVYHPIYISVCCDLEFTLAAKALNKQFCSQQVILKHEHPANGYATDTLYKRNESKELFVHDMWALYKRASLNYSIPSKDLPEDIVLPSSLDFFGKPSKDVEWSILICTLDSRVEKFSQLYLDLLKQIKDNKLQKKVEILFFKDNKKYSVGYKRNMLLHQSRGKYVCFVDDDDKVHENYIKMIYEKLKAKPDCLSLQGIITISGENPKKFIHSVAYKSFYEKGGVYYRPPNHLNVIRRDIAIKFKFPEINYGEDSDWAMQICKSGLLKNEAKITIPYYFYLFDNNQSEVKSKHPISNKPNKSSKHKSSKSDKRKKRKKSSSRRRRR